MTQAIRNMSRDELLWHSYYIGWNDMETMFSFGEEEFMAELLDTPDRYLREGLEDFYQGDPQEEDNSVGYMDHMIDHNDGYTIRETGEHFTTFAEAIDHINRSADHIVYKGFEIVRDVLEGYWHDLDGTVEYGVHEGVGEDWERYLFFGTLEEAREYIDTECA